MSELKVKDIYNELLESGYNRKDAAKEAQARTGLSVVTGKPFKQKNYLKNLKNVYRGQYGKQDS